MKRGYTLILLLHALMCHAAWQYRALFATSTCDFDTVDGAVAVWTNTSCTDDYRYAPCVLGSTPNLYERTWCTGTPSKGLPLGVNRVQAAFNGVSCGITVRFEYYRSGACVPAGFLNNTVTAAFRTGTIARVLDCVPFENAYQVASTRSYATLGCGDAPTAVDDNTRPFGTVCETAGCTRGVLLPGVSGAPNRHAVHSLTIVLLMVMYIVL